MVNMSSYSGSSPSAAAAAAMAALGSDGSYGSSAAAAMAALKSEGSYGSAAGYSSEVSGIGFQDKRNRNPNWTDHEIVRFLEMLQEDENVKDLVANRNKKVFCTIAQRMCNDGAEKSWDQCRIKLKNLKSQYRYVKERIPNIDELDLEDDNVVRQLIAECQGRGISPSSIKHLRFLLRFLGKVKVVTSTVTVKSEYISAVGGGHGLGNGGTAAASSTTGSATAASPQPFTHCKSRGHSAANFKVDDVAVSPPCSPAPCLRIIPEARRKHVSLSKLEPIVSINEDSSDLSGDTLIMNDFGNDLDPSAAAAAGGVGGPPLPEDGFKFIEKFNRDMMDQFMEYQRRSQATFTRWEQERWRQERESMDRWRQEAREHERQLFGMFCAAMAKCNATLTSVIRAKAGGSGGGGGGNFDLAVTASSSSSSSAFSKRSNNNSNNVASAAAAVAALQRKRKLLAETGHAAHNGSILTELVRKRARVSPGVAAVAAAAATASSLHDEDDCVADDDSDQAHSPGDRAQEESLVVHEGDEDDEDDGDD